MNRKLLHITLFVLAVFLMILVPIKTKKSGCMESKRFSYLFGQKINFDQAKAHYPGPLEGACGIDDGEYKLYIL
jgi:hypothetical protein